MASTITVRLDDDLSRKLDDAADGLGRSRSDLVRDALRRHLPGLRFEKLREQVIPFAEARGYLTDEDVIEVVS
jgi:predicted transcriptional regulator